MAGLECVMSTSPSPNSHVLAANTAQQRTQRNSFTFYSCVMPRSLVQTHLVYKIFSEVIPLKYFILIDTNKALEMTSFIAKTLVHRANCP